MTARSRRFACATLLLVFALGASEGGKKKGGEATKEGAAPQTWYAQLFTHGDTIVRVDHTWSKGRKLRSELVVQGRSYLTLVSGDRYIIIDQTGGTGIAIRRSPEAIALDAKRPNERPFGREAEDLIAKGAEVVRSDTLNGRPCRVYRKTDEFGKREIWVTDDKQKLPLRVEFFARDAGAHTITDFIEWLADVDLPDAFFEPDPRVPLETVEYADYVERSKQGPVGPAPVLFAPLLHGK